MIATSELAKVLDCLEVREFELIGWGDTDIYFSTGELEEIIQAELPGHDPEDVEDELRDRVMIVPVLDGRDVEVGVRTRMAEAIHLFRNLRQWFVGQELYRTSTLVSDYRFVRVGRRYPNRNIELEPQIEKWQESFLKHESTTKALGNLVGNFNLSGFQARATGQILSAWECHRNGNSHSTATIVCAGTGSGKTMAFYLPTLSSLVTDIQQHGEHRVRILAVYPRRELLKDQFHETWEQARKLDNQLLGSGSRKIRIGALFGEIHNSAQYVLQGNQEYSHFRLLKCADSECRGEMRWSKTDIKNSRERLACHLCGHAVSSDEVALTRQSVADSPPDILFTTTEMLNQRMTDTRFRHLFGIGVAKSLPLLLLDEVHTYSGSQGAQTALLLRRWMRLSGNRPHFVGLSATLRDAANFFATLTGTNRSRVTLIEPHAEEMVEKGAEYLLALRGDPVSQTALLSTTIQAAMLTRRILDHPIDRKSHGLWGSKTFVFTDDLDVNNRLYSALADAEGWYQRRGGLVPNPDGPLAQLRNASTGNVSPKSLKNYGQDWSVAKASGFPLDKNDRARVARTSSQDIGYDRDAEIVVTTSQLEVGFNDTDVGAVIQHKAPRGVASYLQRRGRGGRQRRMRPWMLIVLSDFGRDRVAYQQYENLIDPEVKVQSLPVDNGHILKMQAALATLDWFSQKIKSGSMWNWLNNPNKKENRTGIEQLLVDVDTVMFNGPVQDGLSDYIRLALGLSETQLNRVLWQAPRSIFLEFLPTLRRRLSSNWAVWSDTEHRSIEWAEVTPGWSSPVPEFIPSASFSDLNVPDLHVRLERRGDAEWEGMEYFQGLKEFAPGRISKRYAVASGAISDWLVPNNFQLKPEETIVKYEIEEAFGSTMSLIASISLRGLTNHCDVYQPNRVLVTSLFADRTIADTSDAFLRWRSIFLPPNGGVKNSVPGSSNWVEILKDVTFFTHSMMSPLELIRCNTGSDANIKFRDGRSANIQFDWVKQGKGAAVGARLFVDAVQLQFSISDIKLGRLLSQDDLSKVLRAGIFQDRLRQDPIFSGNKFTADWVFECFLAAVVLEQALNDCDLESSIGAVCDGRSTVLIEQVPKFLFQMDSQRDFTASEDSTNNDVNREQKLQKQLKELLEAPKIREVLRRISACLYVQFEEIHDVHMWVRNVLANTLAAALQQTLCVLLPNVDERSVNADVDHDENDSQRLNIWLSEAESGGIGIVTQLQDLYASDPLKVLNTFYRCLQPGDYEQLDSDLHDALGEVAQYGDLARAFEKLRASSGYKNRLTANRDLRSMLSERGFVVSHSFAAVMHSRVLRPGSTAETDIRLLHYLDRWHEIESRCGFEIPLNIVANIIAVEEVSTDDPEIAFDRACTIQSMLWVRGSSVRQSSLNYYNPFQTSNTRTERLLGATVCHDRSISVIYMEESWLQDVHHALDETGQVDLVLTRSECAVIPNVMATLHVKALDTHGLLLFPRAGSLTRRGNEIRLRVELAEAMH